VTTLRDVRDGFADYRAWATDPTPRIGLGLPFFDGPTRGGIAKAECAMFLAYSSVGKTSLALNMILQNAHVPTVFFSIEMSWRLVVARLAAAYTGTPTWELEAALKVDEYVGQLDDTARDFPLLLGNDQSEISIKQMRDFTMDAGKKLGSPVRLVVVDYLELIGGAGMLAKSEAVDKAAQKIRSLAKDCDCAVAVLHQVGKGDGSGGHQALSLDSGKYGGHHPMDYVLGAYAPRLNRELGELERERVQEELYLQLLKNRSGKANPTGVRHVQDARTGRITPYGQFVPPRPGRGYQAPLDAVSVPSTIESHYYDPEEEPF
jgi:hypothetical protein